MSNIPVGWQGTDGSETALIAIDDKVFLWTNFGEWIEIHTDGKDVIEVVNNLAAEWKLEPMYPDRLKYLIGE